MKKIKFLVVALLVITMLSSFALAATTVGLTCEQIEYNNEDTITLSIVPTESIEIGLLGSTLHYDKDVFKPTAATGYVIFDAAASGTLDVMWEETATLTKNESVATVTFEVLDKDKVVGSVFSFTDTLIYDADAINEIQGTDIAMTITSGTPTPVDPEKPVITTVSEEKGATVETEDTIYTNIFKGEYTAAPIEGVAISEIGIKYHKTDVTADDAVTLNKTVSIEGPATVSFKAAILGVAADTELVVEPYTVYDFAK